MTAVRRVVLCIDDVGLDAAVTDAAAALADAGLLGAASALVDGPDWPGAAARLRGRPVDLGLHLNLTQAWRPGAAGGHGLARTVLRAATGRLAPAALRATIDAQLDAFVREARRLPEHIDGHQHVHQLPRVREVLVERIAAWWSGSGSRPWLRSTWPLAQAGSVKGWVIAALGAARLRQLAREAGCPVNAAFVGIHGFEGGAPAYATLCQAWLRDAPDGCLWMCHPAAAPVPGDPIAAARLAEYTVWQRLAPVVRAQCPGLRFLRGSEVFRP